MADVALHPFETVAAADEGGVDLLEQLEVHCRLAVVGLALGARMAPAWVGAAAERSIAESTGGIRYREP